MTNKHVDYVNASRQLNFEPQDIPKKHEESPVKANWSPIGVNPTLKPNRVVDEEEKNTPAVKSVAPIHTELMDHFGDADDSSEIVPAQQD